MDKLYTVKETTALLKISRATLYQIMAKGFIKALKLGGRTLFSGEEIARFIKELKAKGSL